MSDSSQHPFFPIVTVSATIRMPPPLETSAQPVPPLFPPNGAPLPLQILHGIRRSGLRFWACDYCGNQFVERAYECFQSPRHVPYRVAYVGVSTSEKVIGYRRPRSGRQTKASISPDWAVMPRAGHWPLLRACCRASRPGVRAAGNSQLSSACHLRAAGCRCRCRRSFRHRGNAHPG
jgi:hypothetical protein